LIIEPNHSPVNKVH